MRGFCLLLMLALVVVALAICGPPAIAWHSDYLTSQYSIASSPVTVEETPAAAPALAQVVQDSGSTDGTWFVGDVNQNDYRLACCGGLALGKVRQAVRLLCFLC